MIKLSEEGRQPRKNYVHSSNIEEEIFARLGVLEGQERFNHRFAFAENLMDLIDWIQSCEKQNLLVSKHTKKPIKTKFNPDIIEKINFVWKRNGYRLTQWEEKQNANVFVKSVKWTKYFPEEPNKLEAEQEIARLPSLRNLKPMDKRTDDTYMIRIGEPVAVATAFENEDPIQLSKVGKMQYEWHGKIYDMFETIEDIKNSRDFTKHVGRHFFDDTTNLLFDVWSVFANEIRAVIFKMGKEIKEYSSDSESKQKTQNVAGLE